MLDWLGRMWRRESQVPTTDEAEAVREAEFAERWESLRALRSQDGNSYGAIDLEEAALRIKLFGDAEAGLRYVLVSGMDRGEAWLLLRDPDSGEWGLWIEARSHVPTESEIRENERLERISEECDRVV